jgi:hypothetical protein
MFIFAKVSPPLEQATAQMTTELQIKLKLYTSLKQPDASFNNTFLFKKKHGNTNIG